MRCQIARACFPGTLSGAPEFSRERMSFQQSLGVRLPPRADWLGLALMALSAPMIAGYIHSICVFHRGIRLYNAEIGGIFFNGSIPPYPRPMPGDVLLW